MNREIKKHIGYSISLAAIVALGIFLALQLSYSRQLQMLVIVMTTFSYVGLGIVHHKVNHDLSPKIVIEYVLIGSIGMTIVSFFLRGL